MSPERLKIGQPRFLTLVEILDAHETAIARHRGARGVRDHGALDSALAMPEQSFGGEFAHSFPFEMASAYAFHIAKNHPFVDGNKRTAFVAAVLFLWMNGWRLEASEADAERAVLDIVANKIDKAGFAEWMQTVSSGRPSLELREFFSRLRFEIFAPAFEAIFPDPSTKRLEEFAATRSEASDAIPVVLDLLKQVVAAQRKEDTVRQAVNLGSTVTLMTLFRLAEDMGYEW